MKSKLSRNAFGLEVFRLLPRDAHSSLSQHLDFSHLQQLGASVVYDSHPGLLLLFDTATIQEFCCALVIFWITQSLFCSLVLVLSSDSRFECESLGRMLKMELSSSRAVVKEDMPRVGVKKKCRDGVIWR